MRKLLTLYSNFAMLDSMKILKRTIITILLLIGALAVLSAVLIVSPGLQTSLAKRFLPDGVGLERVDLGLQGVTIAGFTYRDQDKSVAIDRIDSSFSLISCALKRHLHLTDLSLDSVVVEIVEAQSGPKPLRSGELLKADDVPRATDKVQKPGTTEKVVIPWGRLAEFDGVLPKSFKWPPITIDQLAATGKFIPAGTGKPMMFKVEGADLKAGAVSQISALIESGDFEKDHPLQSVSLDNNLEIKISGAGRLQAVWLKVRVKARGRSASGAVDYPEVLLDISLADEADGTGESYRLSAVVAPQSEATTKVAQLELFSRGAGLLAGSWKLDFASSTFETLTRDLLQGAAADIKGAGTLEMEAGRETAALDGELSISGKSLDSFREEFRQMSQVQADLQFSAEAKGNSVRLRKWQMTLDAPVDTRLVEMRSAQPFGVELDTMRVNFEDPQKPLMTAKLNGLPTALVNSFLPDTDISLDSLSGSLALSAPEGRFRLSTDSPISLRGLSVAQGDAALVDNVDISATGVLKYSDDRLDFDLPAVRILQAEKSILEMSAQGVIIALRSDIELDVESDLSLDLGLLARQPLAADQLPKLGGAIKADISASGTAEKFDISFEAESGQLEIGDDIRLRDLRVLGNLDRESFSLERLDAIYEEGSISAVGRLRFETAQPSRPYRLNGKLKASNFDVGRFLRIADPEHEPALDAVVSATAELVAQAEQIDALAESLTGDISLTAERGTFRGLRKGSLGNVIGLAGLTGQLVGQLTGKQDTEAVGKLVSYFNAIRFNVFEMDMRRNADGSLDVGRFFMRNEDLLMEGAGRIENQAGLKLYEQPIDLAFELGTRPPIRKLFDRLHLLKDAGQDADNAIPSDDGYTYLKRPVEIKGQLNRPDSSAFWKQIGEAALRRLTEADEQKQDGERSDAEKIIKDVRSVLGF